MPTRRLDKNDYAVDAVTEYPPSEASAEGGSTRGAKALVGAWLCRRMEDGTVMRRRITETEAPLASASPTPQNATRSANGVLR